MLIFFFVAAVIAALYWVSRILLPEMVKPVRPKTVPGPGFPDFSQPHGPLQRIEKLETLLAEKNRNISLLQTELKIFQVQVRDFDKIKTLLEEEIRRLREQNRIFRSELGFPTTHTKENSIT